MTGIASVLPLPALGPASFRRRQKRAPRHTLAVLMFAALAPASGAAWAQDSGQAAQSNDAPVTVGSINPSAFGTARAVGRQSRRTEIDIDSLTKDSDFTVFMRPGVPEDVQRKALRKLWTTDDAYNQVAPHE